MDVRLRHARDVLAVQREQRAAAAKPCQVEFRGTKGTIYFQGNGYEVVPEVVPAGVSGALAWIAGAKGWRSGSPMIEARQVPSSEDATVEHAENFLDCIKSRDGCGCDIEIGHRSTSATLIANVAQGTGSNCWNGMGRLSDS